MTVLLPVFCEGAASSADDDDDADINMAAGAEEAAAVVAPGDATERSNGNTASPASRSQCDVMSLPVKFEPAALPSSVSHSWRLEWLGGGGGSHIRSQPIKFECAGFGQSVTEGRCVTLGVSPSNLNVPGLVRQSQREDVSH